jgi:hypothetical protein
MMGLEPTTSWATTRRSTTELHPPCQIRNMEVGMRNEVVHSEFRIWHSTLEWALQDSNL